MVEKKLIGQLSKMERDKIAIYAMKVRSDRGRAKDKPVCDTEVVDPACGVCDSVPSEPVARKLPAGTLRPRVRLCPIGYEQVR